MYRISFGLFIISLSLIFYYFFITQDNIDSINGNDLILLIANYPILFIKYHLFNIFGVFGYAIPFISSIMMLNFIFKINMKFTKISIEILFILCGLHAFDIYIRHLLNISSANYISGGFIGYSSYSVYESLSNSYINSYKNILDIIMPFSIMCYGIYGLFKSLKISELLNILIGIYNNKHIIDRMDFNENKIINNISLNVNKKLQENKIDSNSNAINKQDNKESNNKIKEYKFPKITNIFSKNKEIELKTSNIVDIKKISISLINALEEFSITGTITNASIGPVVTIFEFEPARGIKISRITSLNHDIARALSAISIRMYAIPGKTTVAIEIPNNKHQVIHPENVFLLQEKYDENYIPLFLGLDVGGSRFTANLSQMPHLLVAGSTGSGKSVGLNAMILSMLYTKTPDECQFVMIDPKMLEFSVYEGIPHLIMPVINDMKLACNALKWVVNEMERRYYLMSQVKTRNISQFNEVMHNYIETNQKIQIKQGYNIDKQSNIAFDNQKYIEPKKLSRLVIIIDELADLMLTAGKEVEPLIQRISQMGRASGIHMILATQRPSVDVITGTIKANFPTRISFHLTTKIDSKTILGSQGAEQLLGKGDMLYMFHGQKNIRLHSAYISDKQVSETVTDIINSNKDISYSYSVHLESYVSNNTIIDSYSNEDDELIQEAIKILHQEKKISISFLQRKLRIGYNRAARIVEHMVENNIIGEQDKSGKRSLI